MLTSRSVSTSKASSASTRTEPERGSRLDACWNFHKQFWRLASSMQMCVCVQQRLFQVLRSVLKQQQQGYMCTRFKLLLRTGDGKHFRIALKDRPSVRLFCYFVLSHTIVFKVKTQKMIEHKIACWRLSTEAVLEALHWKSSLVGTLKGTPPRHRPSVKLKS